MILLVLNIFWCAALPLVEATTLGHLKGRLGDYGRIRVWGSVSFVLVGRATRQLPGSGRHQCAAGDAAGPVQCCARRAAWLLPADAGHVHHEEHVPLGRILRRPEVVALFAACFLMALAHGPYNTFYSIQLVDNGYSKSRRGLVVGARCDRRGLRVSADAAAAAALLDPWIISFSLGCAVVRFLIIGWLSTAAGSWLLAQLMHAATFGAHHAAALAAIHQLFRGRTRRAARRSIPAWGSAPAGPLGGLASGWLWEHAGPALTFTFALGRCAARAAGRRHAPAP